MSHVHVKINFSFGIDSWNRCLSVHKRLHIRAQYCPPPHTHTESQTLCVWAVGGRGEGADYDELQRNMANSGFLRIKLIKTTWTF